MANKTPFYPPLGPLGVGKRYNRTLHGRSRYRRADVPGHNVFHGYNNPGWGDGGDLFVPAGTPVYALADGELSRNAAGTAKENLWLTGPWGTAVYAHVRAKAAVKSRRVKRGEVIGYVSPMLRDPHLHFELSRNLDGKQVPLVGQTGAGFAFHLKEVCGLT